MGLMSGLLANWLDPAGHSEGSMIYRWNQADASPIPAARKVKLSELSTTLPAGTARVTPAERARQIEIRRTHVRRRLARRALSFQTEQRGRHREGLRWCVALT